MNEWLFSQSVLTSDDLALWCLLGVAAGVVIGCVIAFLIGLGRL